MKSKKIKLAIISSVTVGFVAGGILMTASPAFASSNISLSNSPASTSSKISVNSKHYHPQWLQVILRKNVDQVATDLHMTRQQLVQDLSSRKSLNDIAASSDVTQAQLQSDLQTMIQNELQAQVTAHHMTSTREAKLQKNLDNQLPKFMANEHILHKPNKYEASMNVLNFVAARLHITRAKLISQLRSGKSITQIATALNFSPSKLQSDITQKLDAQINTKVEKLMNKASWFQHNGSVSTTTSNS